MRLALALCTVLAATPARGPIYPASTAWVVDAAGVLSDAERTELTVLANRLHADGTAQLGIAIVPPSYLGDLQRTEYAVELFKRWKLGHSAKVDDGLLLLFVTGPSGRRGLKVEVGYGLEGILPDGKVGALMDEYAGPPLREGRFGAAGIALANALAREIEAAPSSLPAPAVSSRPRAGAVELFPAAARTLTLLLLLPSLSGIALFVLLVYALARRRYPSRAPLAILFAMSIVYAGVCLWSFRMSVFSAQGLLVNVMLYALVRRHRCPRDRGWLEFSQTATEPTPSTLGSRTRWRRCKNGGCGYEDHLTSDWTFAERQRSVNLGPREWVVRDRGSSSSSFGSSSGGGGSFSGGGGSFSGGGGGRSGGGGADREY